MKVDRVFRKLADNMPFMMAYIDKDERYAYVNRRYENFFDVKLADLKGKAVTEVVDPRAYPEIRARHQKVLAGEEVRTQSSVLLNNGKTVKLDIRYVPNIDGKDQQVTGFFATLIDISPYASVTEVLRAVHDVMNRQSQTLSTDRIEKLLKLGCHYLQTDIGIVSKVVDDTYTVKHVYSESQAIEPDTKFPLGDTYCSVTVTADDVIATAAASGSDEFRGHPCVNAFNLETYLGLPLKINGQTWGTLNFTSASKRLEAFSSLDKELMGLLCSAIETIIFNNSKTSRLEQMAYTDFLTGLTNRLYITEQVNRLSEVDHGGADSFFALIDIDHFKSVNDSYGHDAGDEVLQAVAMALGEAVRASDLCARVGGEEFALVLMDIDKATAVDILQRIRTAVAALEVNVNDDNGNRQRVNVTVSLGATEFVIGDEFNQLYKRADLALYESKRQGRNQLTWRL